MGAALIGPLIISTTTAARNEVLEQLRHLAAEREIVTNELDHRIKNLFALVNALVSLSVRIKLEMKPLADILRSRIGALHRAHGLIRTDTSLAPRELASLKELLGALLQPYEGAETIDGDEAFIDRGIVAPLALVFHELATNSAKYGALGDSDGSLSVDISRNIGELRITWIEKSPVKASSSDIEDIGFGSKLLDLIIDEQLQGKYARTYTDRGMNFEIILPGHCLAAPQPNRPSLGGSALIARDRWNLLSV
jgi:two-component sensor histidine kinase